MLKLDKMDLEELTWSGEYADFLMNTRSEVTAHICNGNALTDAMERGLLFKEFLIDGGYMEKGDTL